MQYTFFWLTGTAEVLNGDTPEQALTLGGYSNGAVPALDFHGLGDLRNEYFWDSARHRWTKLEVKPYLIQRANFEERSGKKGIDSIIKLDYMGSAEFEWGALPEALGRIRDRLDDYRDIMFVIGGKEITIFAPDSIEATTLLGYLRKLGENDFRLKERSDFDTYIHPEKAMFPNRTDFWWDIKNDIMFWKKDDAFEEKFRELIGGE